jgi:hypothetical protein
MGKKILFAFMCLFLLAVGVFALPGNSIRSFFMVDNSSNILVIDENYSLGLAFENVSIVCPQGDFYVNGNACKHSGSNQTINGWEIIDFNTTLVNNLTIKVANLGDGCTTDCDRSVGTKIFVTFNLTNSSTWSYIGFVTVLPNVTTTKIFGGINKTINEVLVARGPEASTRPDPRWYWVSVA